MTDNTHNTSHRQGTLIFPLPVGVCLSFLACTTVLIHGFSPVLPSAALHRHPFSGGSTLSRETGLTQSQPSRSSTALNVWWFGGTEGGMDDDADSCELVAVRIERPSSNSRRIAGEITVDTPLMDVWAILTDYDRLSTHVPNLVESKRISSGTNGGEQGDGQYECRLYQKGAQKIVGFEFGASVTMDMKETAHNTPFPEQKKISFKCVDSQFFSEFDGEWRLAETIGEDGNPRTTVSYEVLVRPKGPVPVMALEWRIREDVPTNLRAVKRAAVETGFAGVMASRQPSRPRQMAAALTKQTARVVRDYVGRAVSSNRSLTPVPVTMKADWGDDETMAAYL